MGTVVGFAPDPYGRAQMTVLLIMAGLVAASLWLRRRDRRVYEWRLAQATAARAVAEDRLVIARELHDAVSGNLGAITVRCAVAQRLETTPEGLRSALSDVETASRQATDGLRRMLAVLRDESTPPTPGAVAEVAAVSAAATAAVAGADSAGAADAPGGSGSRPGERRAEVIAADLTEVVDRARRAGVTVEIDADAGAGAGADTDPSSAVLSRLPAPAARAAVRVVAEALANTARHAGPTCARVTLRQGAGLLRIAVVDDGPVADWKPQPGAGQGLRGLHERLTALGGTLAAGPRTDAPGFAVEASLPDLAVNGGQTVGSVGLPDRGRVGPGRPIKEPPGSRSVYEERSHD